MPATSVWISNDKTDQRMMFITQVYNETGFTVNIYRCDEDFIPRGEPVTRELTGNEVDYHKSLRKASAERGQYVPGHSTNPEWNPDYNPSADKGGHDGC